MHRVQIHTLHPVIMNFESKPFVEAEPYGTEKSGQIFFLVGCRVQSDFQGSAHGENDKRVKIMYILSNAVMGYTPFSAFIDRLQKRRFEEVF